MKKLKRQLAKTRMFAELKRRAKAKMDAGMDFKRAVQETCIEHAIKLGWSFFKIVNAGDDKVCKACRQLEGKVFSDRDVHFPHVRLFISDEGLHPNCRCYAKAIDEDEAKKDAKMKTLQKKLAKAAVNEKTIGSMAMNTANFEDEIVYRGFVKDVQEDEYEFDDRWVMIAPLGEYVGANTKGEQIEEKLTPEAFEAIVMAFHANDLQIPLDKDHASLKEPLHRDTQAYGWLKDLRLMSGGADDYNGLYAKIEWTPEGMALVTTKAYRFLSPVFVLGEDNQPTQLVNVALTNRPNFDLPPIFNTISEEDNLIEDPTMDIEKFKKEIVDAVVNAIAEKKADETTACNEEEKTEEKVEETKDEVKETSCNETAEETKEETKDEAEEAKEEVKEDKEEKEEVIKPEVLNTMPTTITPEIDRLERVEEWRNLKGDDLMAYAYKRTCKNMRAAMK